MLEKKSADLKLFLSRYQHSRIFS